MCGRCCSRQAGLAHVTVCTAVAFHWARRDRVLLRDIFRFGTATVFLLQSLCLRYRRLPIAGEVWLASVRTHACTLYSAGSSRCKRQPNLRVSLPETPPTAELIAVLEHCTVPAMTEQQVFMPTTTKAVFMPCCRMR